MRLHPLAAALVSGLVLLAAPLRAADDAAWAAQWVVEQLPGGTTAFRDETIEINDAAGATVWLRGELRPPFVIRYELTLVSAGGPNDRASDANCFILARDPHSPDGSPYAEGFGRSGRFSDYDSLKMYYVGMGGNDNTTTRFRRYAGDGTKPLRPEHDLRDPRFLLEPNRTYRIIVGVNVDGTVLYYRDGELIFRWQDPDPIHAGWFGFRTVRSHQLIRKFEIIFPE